MRGLFSDLTMDVLSKSLDITGTRHRVIADNIANAETPGFTRSDISFRDELRRALSSSDEEAAGRMVRRMEPKVELDGSGTVRPNGNNVIIDKEMAEMLKNSLDYEAYVRLLSLKIGMLNTAITEGKR